MKQGIQLHAVRVSRVQTDSAGHHMSQFIEFQYFFKQKCLIWYVLLSKVGYGIWDSVFND